MRNTGCLRGRRCASLFFAGLTGFALPAWALDCAVPAPALSAGVERSQWEEFDAQGRSLVRETGTLERIGVDASTKCAGLDWTAQWSHGVGRRAYDGVTNTQVAVQSTSHLSSDALSLIVMSALGEHWAVGARLSYHQLNRDIDGAGTVLGYPERYTYGLASLGARYQLMLVEQLHLVLTGWLGGNTGGRLWVQLPRADAATLPLGSTALIESSVQLGSAPTSTTAWSWQAILNYRQELTAAGDARALLRNGVLVGAAAQPKLLQRLLGVHAVLRYRF